MTDRHAGYLITLTADIREDGAEATLNALRMVKGVASVEPVVSNLELHIGQQRADRRWREALINLVKDGVDADTEGRWR
jgi:hypothetical protein